MTPRQKIAAQLAAFGVVLDPDDIEVTERHGCVLQCWAAFALEGGKEIELIGFDSLTSCAERLTVGTKYGFEHAVWSPSADPEHTHTFEPVLGHQGLYKCISCPATGFKDPARGGKLVAHKVPRKLGDPRDQGSYVSTEGMRLGVNRLGKRTPLGGVKARAVVSKTKVTEIEAGCFVAEHDCSYVAVVGGYLKGLSDLLGLPAEEGGPVEAWSMAPWPVFVDEDDDEVSIRCREEWNAHRAEFRKGKPPQLYRLKFTVEAEPLTEEECREAYAKATRADQDRIDAWGLKRSC